MYFLNCIIQYCIIDAKGASILTDDNENSELSGADIVFAQTALEALKEDLAGYLEDETKRETAQWHIELATSAWQKLENRELEFSDDEGRVMYIAALAMRDFMNRILDDKAPSEHDREMARTTLYSANAMLRILRKTFAANGISVEDLT